MNYYKINNQTVLRQGNFIRQYRKLLALMWASGKLNDNIFKKKRKFASWGSVKLKESEIRMAVALARVFNAYSTRGSRVKNAHQRNHKFPIVYCLNTHYPIPTTN